LLKFSRSLKATHNAKPATRTRCPLKFSRSLKATHNPGIIDTPMIAVEVLAKFESNSQRGDGCALDAAG